MPNTFPDTLSFLIKHNRITIEVLAERSGLGTSTIKRLKKCTPKSISVETVLRLCVGLRLHPLVSKELVRCSPIRFCFTVDHILCQEFLLHIQEMSYEQCEEELQYLKTNKFI